MIHDTLAVERFSWAGSTHQEIGEVGEQDNSILIVPIGSIEQHGHHLPVATDSILVDAVVSKTGTHLTEIEEDIPFLVTPTMWSGYSPHHMTVGGTLTASFSTLLALLTDITKTGLEGGFDTVLLVNGHGGNAPLISAATSELGSELPDKRFFSCSYFKLATPFVDEIRDSKTGGIAHGGEFETSLMLCLRPDLVQLDRLNVTYREDPYSYTSKEMFDAGPLSVYRSFAEMSETGELGDPTLATERKGKILLENLVAELTTIICEIHKGQ